VTFFETLFDIDSRNFLFALVWFTQGQPTGASGTVYVAYLVGHPQPCAVL